MAAEKEPFDLNTWLWWIALTALGNTTGIVVISILVTMLGASLFGAGAEGQPASPAFHVAMAPLFALAGAIIGFSQWIVLRGLISRAGWWILATAGGWLAGYLWSTLLFPPGTEAANFVVVLFPWVLFGLATGICQWLILRNFYERSGTWIPAATLAAAIGAMGWLVGGVFGGTVMWLFGAAITGWVLMRYLPPKRLWPEQRESKRD